MSAISFIKITVQKLYMDRAKENNLLTIKGKKGLRGTWCGRRQLEMEKSETYDWCRYFFFGPKHTLSEATDHKLRNEIIILFTNLAS